MRAIPLFALCGILISNPTFASDDAWDKADQDALDQVQKMMLDPPARAAAIKGDAGAMSAAEQAKSAVGGDKAKEAAMYSLGMDMFAKIAKEEHGDVDKIQARLNAYMAKPDSVGGMMTEDQKAQLRKLANQH